MWQKKALAPRLLSRFLPLVLMAGAVWLASSMYLFWEVERAHKVRVQALAVEESLHGVIAEEAWLLLEDLDESDFFTGRTENTRRHAVSVGKLHDSIRKLLSISPENQKPRIQHLLDLTEEYRSAFRELIEAYRVRGCDDWGLQRFLLSNVEDLGKEISKTGNLELQRKLLDLRIHEIEYFQNSDHVKLATVSRIRANLRELQSSIQRTGPAAYGARYYYERHADAFARHVLIQNLIGFDQNHGLRRALRQKLASLEPELQEVVSQVTTHAEKLRRDLFIITLAIMLFALFSETVAVYFLVQSIIRPLKTLTEAAMHIRLGRLERLPIFNTEDEVAILSSVFNETIDHLQESRSASEKSAAEAQKLASELQTTQQQLMQSHKLEAIGTLAGGIAHDFNNILAAILSYTGLLKRHLKEDERAVRDLRIIEQSAERGADLTGKLLGFARKGKYQKSIFDINQTMNEAKALLARTLGKTIVLSEDLAPDIWSIEGDTTQLLQVIMNLGINARDAMPNGGELHFQTSNETLEPDRAKELGVKTGHYVRICVRDNGCGIPKEIQAKIFDPFFTTKEVGKGSGLGLAMVYGIVKNHEGVVRVTSEPDHGACFEIFLPAVNSTIGIVPEEPRQAQIAPHSLHGQFILVVDDEEFVRDAAKDVLEAEGAIAFFASSGEEAVQFCTKNHSLLYCVVMDLVMPKMDGITAFHQIRGLNPAIRIVLCSGYAEDSRVAELGDQASFLQKPFKGDDLIRKILGI